MSDDFESMDIASDDVAALDLGGPTVEEQLARMRAEAELLVEFADATETFEAAKRAKDAAAGDDREAWGAYREAKARFVALRTYWRQIGEAVGTRNPIGVIAATVNAGDHTEESGT